MGSLKINHLAVWTSFVLLTILGFLWYGPIFGEPWMRHVGLDPSMVEENPPGAAIWITNAVATIIPLYTLAWLFVRLRIENALQGAMIGLLIAFSFVFLSNMTGDMFAQRPYGLTWITGGYTMVALALAGTVMGAWRKYSG